MLTQDEFRLRMVELTNRLDALIKKRPKSIPNKFTHSLLDVLIDMKEALLESEQPKEPEEPEVESLDRELLTKIRNRAKNRILGEIDKLYFDDDTFQDIVNTCAALTPGNHSDKAQQQFSYAIYIGADEARTTIKNALKAAGLLDSEGNVVEVEES